MEWIVLKDFVDTMRDAKHRADKGRQVNFDGNAVLIMDDLRPTEPKSLDRGLSLSLGCIWDLRS